MRNRNPPSGVPSPYARQGRQAAPSRPRPAGRALAVPADRLLRRVLRRWSARRPARCAGGPRADPGGREQGASSPFATCSAGSATRWTPRTSATGWPRSATRCAARSPRSQAERRELQQLEGLQEINTDRRPERYDPVQARVYQRSPSTWYQTVTLNKGSSDGVAVDDPVVNGAGPRRQGQGGLRRQRGRDAAHRPGLRRLGARAKARRARLDHADPGRARRPAVRPRATTPSRSARATWS